MMGMTGTGIGSNNNRLSNSRLSGIRLSETRLSETRITGILRLLRRGGRNKSEVRTGFSAGASHVGTGCDRKAAWTFRL